MTARYCIHGRQLSICALCAPAADAARRGGKIHGIVNVKIVGPGYTDDPGDPATGKPYIVLGFGDVSVRVTTNVAEMIGGAGRGVNERLRTLGLGLDQPKGES